MLPSTQAPQAGATPRCHFFGDGGYLLTDDDGQFERIIRAPEGHPARCADEEFPGWWVRAAHGAYQRCVIDCFGLLVPIDSGAYGVSRS